MEFKRPVRSRQQQVNPVVPERSNPVASDPSPARHPKPAVKSRTHRMLFSKWGAIIAGIIVVIAVAGLLLFRALNPSDTPGYRTVLPDGKTIDELGGWKRVSPPEKEPVFAYTDQINDVSIGVSQQPLPQSFKSDTASRVADLAKKYNATTEVIIGDTTVYIGTSVKGPQSVIFAKKDLLILIKSQKKIENAAWKEYVLSLGGSSDSLIPKY